MVGKIYQFPNKNHSQEPVEMAFVNPATQSTWISHREWQGWLMIIN